jgi:succinate dehydrogenase / fumarate reductase cytochrome b subunit
MVGFLVEHLHGNLKLIEDPTGESFDQYVFFLQGFGPLLLLAELGLALLFLSHIYLGFRLTIENIQARRDRYVARGRARTATLASGTMFLTGGLLLAYLLKHLLDYRMDPQFFDHPAAHVRASFKSNSQVLLYVGAALVLGLHLSHGVSSAFQSLGISHPGWSVAMRRVGVGVAIALAAGFALIPLILALSAESGQ